MATSGFFQQQVNTTFAPGVLGDFASLNPRWYYQAGPGGLVAGPAGLTVGNFAWVSPSYLDQDNAPVIANNFGTGSVAGFVHREQQALITNFLAASTLIVPAGYQVTLTTNADLWVLNSGTTYAQIGMSCYANYSNGSASFAAAGAASTATASASTISAQTFSVTATINGNQMTVTAVGSGTVYPGAVISGTGISTGNTIVSQLSGTTGGIGVYSLSIAEQNVTTGETVAGTYGLLTVGGTVVGTWGVGQTVTGTGVTAGTYITALGTGAGGAGTYIVNLTQTVASEALAAATNVQTKWFAMSSGAAGEIIKISAQALG